MKRPSTVFVVDDEEVIRHSFEMFLNIIGVPVRTFSSADEFLAAYDETWTGLVIVDIRMTGMNGLELARQLRSRNCPLKLVLMTGNAEDLSLMSSPETGVSEILQKPFSVDSIKRIIQNHFTAS